MNDINKFIAGLNDNQKKLLVITVLVVIVALFDRLLIAPTMSKLSSIEQDIAKEQDSIKQDLRFLQYKDRIVADRRAIDPYLTKNKLSDNEMIAAFLNKIQTLAGQYKITLIKINPNPGEQAAEYWRYRADLECTGGLQDVISFMHAVNADTDLMKVDKYNFNAKKSETDEIKATMTIEKIVVTEKSMPVKTQDANLSQTSASATP